MEDQIHDVLMEREKQRRTELEKNCKKQLIQETLRNHGLGENGVSLCQDVEL